MLVGTAQLVAPAMGGGGIRQKDPERDSGGTQGRDYLNTFVLFPGNSNSYCAPRFIQFLVFVFQHEGLEMFECCWNTRSFVDSANSSDMMIYDINDRSTA